MKSQDIFLLLKLISLEKLYENIKQKGVVAADEYGSSIGKWQDWADGATNNINLKMPTYKLNSVDSWFESRYSVRGLAETTGVSKSEVASSLKRGYGIGLVKPDRQNLWPVVNKLGLWEFLVYGSGYVFPVRLGELTRGIATGFGAPVLSSKLMTAGDLLPVWPDPQGNTKGLAVTPLFKSVPWAVRQDPRLYALLALTDAIRMGRSREKNLASELLSEKLGLKL